MPAMEWTNNGGADALLYEGVDQGYRVSRAPEGWWIMLAPAVKSRPGYLGQKAIHARKARREVWGTRESARERAEELWAGVQP